MTPLQSLFEHSFYAVSDLAFLAVNIYMASIVRRSPERRHLSWIAPFVAQAVLTVVYRGIITAHYFFGVSISPQGYFLAENCLYTANVVGLIANVILCRMLKKMVEESEKGTAAKSFHADETVWPPAPQEERDS